MPLIVYVAAVASLLAGYWLKAQCAAPSPLSIDWPRDSGICFSDTVHVYSSREEPFSATGDYKPLSEHGIPYRDHNFEYPPLTGLFVGGVNALVAENNAAGFLRVNALVLGVVGLLGVAALSMSAASIRRVLLFVLAPELALYGFHNWDLIPVAATAFAFAAFTKRRDAIAGVALGLGTAAKLYPAVFLPVLVVARMKQQQRVDRPADLLRDKAARKRAQPMLMGAVIGFTIPALMVLAYSGFDGWSFPWRYQGARVPNLETFWAWGYRIMRGTTQYPGPRMIAVIQTVSSLGFVALTVALLRSELKRDRFRPATMSLCVLLVYLCTSKFLNPDYMLWVLPFFVLVRLPWRAFAAFVVVDLGAFAAVSWYNVDQESVGAPYVLFGIAVAARYVMMLYLLRAALRHGSDALSGGEKTVQTFHAVRSSKMGWRDIE